MAAPTVDSVVRSAADSSGTGTFVDCAHTSAGANRIALVFPQSNLAVVPTGCTYDGGSHTVSMTSGGSPSPLSFGSGAYEVGAFHLVGQPAAANVARANFASIPSIMGSIVASFNGVHQTTSVGTVVVNSSGGSGAAALTATLATDELLVMHAFGAGASSATTTTGTQLLNTSSGTWGGVFWVGSNSGVGSVSIQCNWDVSVTWGAIAYILKPTAALTSKFRIPTNAPDGTVRTLFVWAEQTLDTLLVPGIDVTASGGFFKYASVSATLGATFPAILSGFGASAAVPASGAFAWATGISE